MKHFRTATVVTIVGMAAVAVMTLLPVDGLSAAAAGAGLPEAMFTDDGIDNCVRCHAGDNMAVVADTVHGNADDPHAPFAQHGCESCHGPGSLHVSRARGGAGFPLLTRFGRGGDPVPDQLGACLACHGEDMGEVPGMAWTGSLHDTGRMTCSSCHQVHAAESVLHDLEQQKSFCATCHEQQITEHNRFEGKGILFDQLTCSSCHDVHQLVARE